MFSSQPGNLAARWGSSDVPEVKKWFVSKWVISPTYKFGVHLLAVSFYPLIRSPFDPKFQHLDNPRTLDSFKKPSNANGRRPIEAIKTIQLGKLRFVITTY